MREIFPPDTNLFIDGNHLLEQILADAARQ